MTSEYDHNVGNMNHDGNLNVDPALEPDWPHCLLTYSLASKYEQYTDKLPYGTFMIDVDTIVEGGVSSKLVD